MFSFFKPKINKKYIASLIIESEMISLGILEELNSTNTVLFEKHIPIYSDHKPDISDLKRRTLESVESVFENCLKQIKNIPEETTLNIILGAPWHLSFIDEIVIKEDKQFKVTKDLIMKALSKPFTNIHPDLSIIAKSIMSYRMNGYSTDDPYNKTTDNLSISVIISAGEIAFLTKIKDSIAKTYPHLNMVFSSIPSAVFKISNTISNSDNSIIIVPEGEVTEIFMTKNNVIASYGTIPFGKISIARSVCTKVSSIKEAQMRLNSIITKELEDASCLEELSILEKIREDFKDEFRELVWKMCDTYCAPAKILVFGKGIISNEIANWIRNDSYISKTFAVENTSIVQINSVNSLLNLSNENNISELLLASGLIYSNKFEFNKNQQ